MSFFISVVPLQLVSKNTLDLILNAGIVAKIVLAILLLFSIISWGIILDKLRVFRRVNKESGDFLHQLRKRSSPKELLHLSRLYPTNPFATVFKEAYWLFRKSNRDVGSEIGGSVELLRAQKAKSSDAPDDLFRFFDSIASREILKLEKNLVFLATTGSVSPFFGLFGTVWGVMSAFLAIGFTGSADLSVVAPGIAEALITTIAGLGAAIPAVIGYNYFVNKLKRLDSELEIFYSDLIAAFSKKDVHEVR